MARRSDIDWEAVRDDYEIRGIGFRELAEKYGISKGGISARANNQNWVKSKIEPLVQLKVDAIQGLNELNSRILNLPPVVSSAIDQEVDRRLRLANLMSDGIEKSQRLANQLVDTAERLGTDNEDGFKAALVATDNHSKVTQRNAATVFGAMPERSNQQTDTRFNSIADKLRAKHASPK